MSDWRLCSISLSSGLRMKATRTTWRLVTLVIPSVPGELKISNSIFQHYLQQCQAGQRYAPAGRSAGAFHAAVFETECGAAGLLQYCQNSGQ